MKKSILSIALIVFSVFLISSCGNSNKNSETSENKTTENKDEVKKVDEAPAKTINSEKFKILSNAKPYIKVVPGEYKPYEKDGYVYIEVKFELLKKYTGNAKQVSLKMEPKNSDGGKVKNDAGLSFSGPVGDAYGERVLEFIKSEPGEKITIECVGYLESGVTDPQIKERAKEFISDLSSFEVKFDMN